MMPQHPSPDPDSAAQARHARLRKLGGLLLACFAAAIFPAWFGLIMLADRLGWAVSATQLLAWLASALLACGAWPWMLYMMYYDPRHQPESRLPAQHRWFDSPPAPMPPLPPLSRADRALRLVILLLGMVALFFLCGNEAPFADLTEAVSTLSVQPHAYGSLSGFLALMLLAAIGPPTLYFADHQLEQTPPDSLHRLILARQTHWLVCAGLAWAACFLAGQMTIPIIFEYL